MKKNFNFSLKNNINNLTLAEIKSLNRLPYAEKSFSKNILQVHLDQSTDQASRRLITIDKLALWMKGILDKNVFESIFHPMCGPGLFTSYFLDVTRLYYGVDIGPEIIKFASLTYQDDIRVKFRRHNVLEKLKLTHQFSICLLTYEAVNAFPYNELLKLLTNCNSYLKKGGYILAETRSLSSIKTFKAKSSKIINKTGGLFYDYPHILIQEGICNRKYNVVGNRFIIQPLNMRKKKIGPLCYHSLVWLYSLKEIRKILADCGFKYLKAYKYSIDDTDIGECANNMFILAVKK